jgi:RNA polymerase sigma-70 factor (ECF subfamily)
MNSDLELVQRLKEGGEKAFELIFDRYFDGLCLFSESITKNHEIAEDIVEDVFLQVWLNNNSIKTSVKSYLYQSVYNNSLKYITRNRNKFVRIDTDLMADSGMFEMNSQGYPVANLIVKELQEKAVKVIDSLPEQCRKIYLLNRDEDLKYHEIADRLSISVGTVKTQMSRAFTKLREELKEFLYLFL